MSLGPNSIKIYKKGEEILEQKSSLVEESEFNSPSLHALVEQLTAVQDEMKAVGIAAPQIGAAKQVMRIGMEFESLRRPNVKPFKNMIFVNPELTSTSEEKDDDWEGCLSIDATLALVDRPIHISYKARDIHGNHINGELSNFPARVFQHEYDHLQGVLVTDKAKEIKEVDPKMKIISLKP